MCGKSHQYYFARIFGLQRHRHRLLHSSSEEASRQPPPKLSCLPHTRARPCTPRRRVLKTAKWLEAFVFLMICSGI